jgi:hypothetical protein
MQSPKEGLFRSFNFFIDGSAGYTRLERKQMPDSLPLPLAENPGQAPGPGFQKTDKQLLLLEDIANGQCSLVVTKSAHITTIDEIGGYPVQTEHNLTTGEYIFQPQISLYSQ